MWENKEDILNSELENEETLLWSGRPKQGIVFRPSDVLMIPFSLMWGGFAIFWEFSVVTSDAPFFFMLWGIPFVLVGLYMIFGRFYLDAKQREKTSYGVTNQRIIIISGIFNRKTKSLNPRTISDISLSEKGDKSGTISFGPSNQFGMWGAGMAWPGMPKPAPSFEMIENAKEVYDIIRKLQN